MRTRSTTFDFYLTTASKLLDSALNDGGKEDIPQNYIEQFCDKVCGFMWRNIRGAIVGMELYGSAEGFVFNMGGYIDAFYEADQIRWRGFSEQQETRLKESYNQVVRAFKLVALDIIEMYLRCINRADVERAERLKSSEGGVQGSFRNLEEIAWLCREKFPTASEVYDIFYYEVSELPY